MNGPIQTRPRPGALAPAVVEAPIQRSALEIDMEVADALARSELVPVAYQGKPSNVLVAIGLGRALGLDPAASLYGMHVINNRPEPSAKLAAALVRKAGHKLRVLESDDTHVKVQIVRADDPDYPVTVDYTVEMARAAGYLDVWVERWVDGRNGGRGHKETWTFPPGLDANASPEELTAAGCPEWGLRARVKRSDSWWTQRGTMLHHRAVTTCVGRACPEVTSGLDFDPVPVEVPAPSHNHDAYDPLEHLVAQPDPDPQPVVEVEGDVVDAEIIEPEVVVDPEPEPEEEPGDDEHPSMEHEATYEEIVARMPIREVVQRLGAHGLDQGGSPKAQRARLVARMRNHEPFDTEGGE